MVGRPYHCEWGPGKVGSQLEFEPLVLGTVAERCQE
jgi:hypothetical protein